MENPLIIFAAAFIFHFFCDTLLHWNIYPHHFERYPYGWVALDVIGGLVVAGLLLGQTALTLPILAAIAGGNMPDVLSGLWQMISDGAKTKWFGWAKPFFKFHHFVQNETDDITRGLLSQIILGALAVLLVGWRL